MAEQATSSIPSTQDNAPGPSRRGGSGRGSRVRRTQARQSRNNSRSQELIDSTERLTLRAPSDLGINWKPSFGLYAGAVGVSARGFQWYVSSMLTRLRSIAQRPLAILLTPINISIYRKVCHYLLHVRLCCAQDDCQVAVAGLSLRGVLTEAEKRTAVGFCRSIPKALSYAFSTYGYFKVDDQTIVPIVQLIAMRQSWTAALNCADFTLITEYVGNHIEVAVPPAAREAVNNLSLTLPQFLLDPQHRFT